MEVREERTGWRDERISKRHRYHWGWDCPAIDIDFLLIEYDKGCPVALVEYKHEYAARQRVTHPSYQAIKKLADAANLPVFAVRYADDFSWWYVVPLNSIAKEWCPERKRMTEQEWVTLLYKMRGYDLPDEIFADQEIEV